MLAGVVTVLTVALALAAEAAVRLRQYVKYGHLWGVEETYRVDPVSGLRIPVPNGEFGAIRINSDGFRGPEIELPKPAGTVRLAFLGASTTYCAEVSAEERTWPHLVWRALADRFPEVRFDYVNAGVPGYGLEDARASLERRVRRFDPDIIFIYEATNDLSGNSFELARRQGLVEQRTEQALSWPSRWSLLWYLVEKNLMIRRQQAVAHSAAGKLAFEREELARPFREDLRELVQASREAADLVVVITFAHQLRRDQSAQDQERAAVTSLYYMPYMSIDGLLEGFDAYNDVIREVATESGVLLVDGEDAIPGDPAHFTDSVHFTDQGSAAMGQRVAAALIRSPALAAIVEVR